MEKAKVKKTGKSKARATPKKDGVKQEDKIKKDMERVFGRLVDAHRELFMLVLELTDDPVKAAGMMYRLQYILAKTEFDFLEGNLSCEKEGKKGDHGRR